MNKSVFAVLALGFSMMAAAAQEPPASPSGAAAAPVARGKLLVAANGTRLGVIDRVNPDGSAKIMIDGRLVTIPGTTLSSVDGRLTTSLTKNEVLGL